MTAGQCRIALAICLRSAKLQPQMHATGFKLQYISTSALLPLSVIWVNKFELPNLFGVAFCFLLFLFGHTGDHVISDQDECQEVESRKECGSPRCQDAPLDRVLLLVTLISYIRLALAPILVLLLAHYCFPSDLLALPHVCLPGTFRCVHISDSIHSR